MPNAIKFLDAYNKKSNKMIGLYLNSDEADKLNHILKMKNMKQQSFFKAAIEFFYNEIIENNDVT